RGVVLGRLAHQRACALRRLSAARGGHGGDRQVAPSHLTRGAAGRTISATPRQKGSPMGALPLVGGDVSGYVVGFAWAVLALGLIVMAVIQSVKDLFPIRRWFNASFTQAWLRRKSAMPGAGIVPDPDTAFDDL